MAGQRALLLGLYPCVLMVFSMLLPLKSRGQTCSNYSFPSNQAFGSCTDLPYLNSYLHWDYHASTGKVKIAYRRPSADTSKWVAWAINPTSTGMDGAQAMVAYQQSNGSVRAYTSPIDGDQTKLEEGNLSFDVSDLSATYASGEMTIFATITLPAGNGTTVNQVWQEGPLTGGGTPGPHAFSGANTLSKGSLDFASGLVGSAGKGGDSRLRRKYIHGLLNAVSWGILMPVGAMVARYLRVFESADPAWFYLHVACQHSGYIVGVAGWATGLKLGSESKGITYAVHRTIGIVLFSLATLQVTALLIRPKKEHKYRKYWNAYHRAVGYAVIVLGIVNIFRGLDALNPLNKWRLAYIGVLMVLGISFLCLEVCTWLIVLRRWRSERPSPSQAAEDKVVRGYGYGAGGAINGIFRTQYSM
ncbi:hypothetical protein SAY86_001255 [Trapa natans]|uniref:Cytochrome b561 and DOMON domain-containing protein n=1 Tax=Trapa natans TaxID=22666 RepID=A0AAN7MDD2_TRANT|nr:hypothetical protein SAY86_001255 [Trapa natans]